MIRHLTKRLKSSLRRKRLTEDRWPSPTNSTFLESEAGLVVHGLHKSATMFLYRFFDELCGQLEIPLFSIHKQAPHNELTSEAAARAFVLCPVRSFDTHSLTLPTETQTRHLFQVRDPRDVLVSEYFSIGWRHTTEGWSAEELQRRDRIRALTVDQYVLAEPEISIYPLLGRYQPLLERISQGNSDDTTTIVNYETMVTDFGKWLRPVLAAMQIDSDVTETFFQFVQSRYEHEFVPDESDKGHRRNVKPGDHREKLTPATIEELNQRFKPVLRAFNYRNVN